MTTYVVRLENIIPELVEDPVMKEEIFIGMQTHLIFENNLGDMEGTFIRHEEKAEGEGYNITLEFRSEDNLLKGENDEH
jgi:hypothetical protein